MGGPDPILAGIIPVNAPRPSSNTKTSKPKKRAATKTVKQDRASKHQTMARDAVKAENFGTHQFSRDEIEAQFIKNRGAFCPLNKLGLSAEDLKKDLDALASKLTAEPFPPTQYGIFTDQAKAPHTFLLQLGHKMHSQDEVNTIELEDKRVGIKKLGPALWSKVIEGRRFNRGRGEAFVAYLRYCADLIEGALKQGDQYNKDHSKWIKHKDLYSTATHLYNQQLSWELNLTDLDRRSIMERETQKDNAQKLDALMDEKLKNLGLIPTEDSASE